MNTLPALEILEARVAQVCSYQQIDPSESEGDLAHFTNWQACCSMLENARKRRKTSRGIELWAGNADCLNDPLEGQALLLFAQDTAHGKLRDKEHVTGRYASSLTHPHVHYDYDHPDLPHLAKNKWSRLFDDLATIYGHKPIRQIVAGANTPELIVGSDTHLVSFCINADRLDLWRAYGEKTAGICLVMPLQAAVARAASSSWGFYRVAYDERSKARAWAVLHEPIKEAAAQLKGLRCEKKRDLQGRIQKILNPVHFLFKHDQFRTEREVRLICKKPTPAKVRRKPNNSGTYIPTERYFLDSAGCRVILGPKCPDKKIRAAVLRSYLALQFPDDTPTIERSVVPFQ